MKHIFTKRLLACLATLLMLWPGRASAAPFTPGNLVVVRVGDGSAALTSGATATFLLEYTPAGVLVQTIALPTAAAGTNSILTNTGTSNSDALLTRSVNGACLVLTGYDAVVGTALLTSTTSAATNRIIGRIAADGTVDTSTRLSDGFSGGNIRSATSVDGTTFYAVGSTGGVRAAPLGNATTSTVITAVPSNNRGVGIYGGNLYVSSATGSGGNFYGISQVGTGLPTTTGQTTTPLPGFPTAASTPTQSPYGFYLADLSASVAGVDVVYVADDRAAPDGGIQKWSLVGGTWTLNGTITGATVRGVSGSVAGTAVTLVASGSSALYLLTDNAGYNAAPSTATLPAPVASAATNTSFRGSAFAPAGTTAAPTITSFTPTSGATGTTVTVTGTDFTGATAVTLNGVVIMGFTVVNPTTITFVVPAGATSGPIAVTTSGGTVTSTGIFTVIVPNPTLVITSLSPSSVVAGAGAFTVVVTGTGFLPSSVVISTAPVGPTTFISATQLSVTLPAGAPVGTYPFTVTNPTPGGGASNVVNLTVTPAPTLTSISPNTAGAGGAAFTLTATGTNFTASSVIRFNGVALATTLVNATTLTATVPAAAIATPGTAPVTISTSAPGGTTSAAVTFTITAPVPAPTIASFSPGRAITGVGFTLTVNGTNLVAGTVIRFNGVNYTGTVVGTMGTACTVVIPSAGVPAPGNYAITATNPGGTSAPSPFQVVAPATTVAYEDFEQGSKNGYATGTVTLRSGDWTFTDALLGNQLADKANQVQSARIRGGGFIAMNFDKTGGGGVIRLNAALYGTDAATSFLLEISTNGGATYTTVPGAPAALTATLTPYSFTVNRAGNVRLRISNTNTAAATNPRINIDDINITGYTGSATLASQAMPGLLVYPNPATDRITVALPTAGAATVALRDLTGRVVLAPAALAADQQLHLPASLATGVYLLEVRQGGITAVRRIEKN